MKLTVRSWDPALRLLLLPVAVLLCLATANSAGKVSFASFDFPGSTNTQATAITPAGEIVGRYFSADGKQHGFVLRDGTFTAVDVPSATFSTDVTWVNARRDIVGSYGDSHGTHAYVLSGGTFTTIDFPSSNPLNTLGFGISNAGDVVRSEEHRLNSSHLVISYAVFCLKKKK